MRELTFLTSRRAAAVLIPALLLLAACGGSETAEAPAEETSEIAAADEGWITLYDSENPSLDDWDVLGENRWVIADDGAVEATGEGPASFLVTKPDYTDFELQVEFWADEPANSGVFLRCSSRETINQDNAYEVNIFDQRPDQTYATGAVVGVAPPSQQMLAANQWNTFDIHIQGGHIMVNMNGTDTVDIEHDGWDSGPIGLQHGAGTIRFRSVRIRPL
jgi:hypothetical protein